MYSTCYFMKFHDAKRSFVVILQLDFKENWVHASLCQGVLGMQRTSAVVCATQERGAISSWEATEMGRLRAFLCMDLHGSIIPWKHELVFNQCDY